MDVVHASTLVQSSREILYATLQHTASSNATDNSRAPSLTPARYGPADYLQPIACTTGPHHFQPPSSTSEARSPAGLPTRQSKRPGLDPTAARRLCAAPALRRAMPYGTPQYSTYLLEISGARKLLEVYSKKNWKRILRRKRQHPSGVEAALFRQEHPASPGSIQGVRFTYCFSLHAFAL